MRIRVLAVGRLKEGYLLEGQAEYLKRLQKYARVEIVEVPDEGFSARPTEAEIDLVKAREGSRLEQHVKPGSYVIALDRQGEEVSSRELAARLERLVVGGRSDLTFIIGGSLGLSSKILERADWRLSFSRLTFPHQLMRLVLLEQLYRCFSIIKGEPYHR